MYSFTEMKECRQIYVCTLEHRLHGKNTLVSSLQHGLYVPTAVRSGTNQLLSILRLFQFTLELDYSKSSVCCSIDCLLCHHNVHVQDTKHLFIVIFGHFHFSDCTVQWPSIQYSLINHMSLFRLKRWQSTFIGRGHESVQTKNETITSDG